MSDHTIDVTTSSAATVRKSSDESQSSRTHSESRSLPRGPSAVQTILLMARVTFRESARRRILWIATIAGVAFLALFWTGLHAMLKHMSPNVPALNRNEGITMMIMMVLYAGSMMTALMAALTSCDTLSGEIATGTIHAIATKPVRRWCLVLGKWSGFVVMFSLYILLIEGGTMAIGWQQTRIVPPHALQALALIWLQAIVLLGVTMASSTRFSALTSGAVSLGLYGFAFVGGWIEQYGALQHVRTCVNLGILSSLIMPSDALWRRAAFKLQPPLLGAAGISPFNSSTIPSVTMVVYAALYAVLALLLAQILFERRDL